jgi:rubrerythrin
MDRKTQKRIKALELAITNEARERDFYLSHSERTTHPLGKKMFRSLANDELEHMERIKILHQRLQQQGRWPEDLPLEVKGAKVKDVLAAVAELGKKAPEADRDDIEAIRIALDFEAKGEAFYRDLAEKTDNSMEREFYRLLSSMEHEHFVSLKETLEFFENPEGWFAARERPTLDGA